MPLKGEPPALALAAPRRGPGAGRAARAGFSKPLGQRPPLRTARHAAPSIRGEGKLTPPSVPSDTLIPSCPMGQRPGGTDGDGDREGIVVRAVLSTYALWTPGPVPGAAWEARQKLRQPPSRFALPPAATRSRRLHTPKVALPSPARPQPVGEGRGQLFRCGLIYKKDKK